MPRLTQNKTFWWFVVVCILFFIAVVASFAVMLWQELSAPDRATVLTLVRRHIGYLFGAGVLLLAGLGFAIDWVFRLYVLPIDKITEETGIIHGVNPGHRIQVEGSRDVVRLAAAINSTADAFEELHRTVELRIEESRARIEEEKRILSAVLAELPEGIVICSAEGLITLYNQRAKELLEEPDDQRQPGGGFVGLGRSVFGAIDRSIIMHALDGITEKMRSGRHDLIASFVMATRGKRLLQAVTVPIFSPLRELAGFVLILTDATRRLETFRRLESLIHSLNFDVRRAIASIRSAVEVVMDFPDLPSAKRQEFHRIIHREALAAGEAANRAAAQYSESIQPPAVLSHVRALDFLEAVSRKASEKLGLRLKVEPAEKEAWVRVDSYSMGLAVLFLLAGIGSEQGREVLRCRLEVKDRLVVLDFIWNGPPLRMDELRRLEQQPVSVADEVLNATLKDVLNRHRAEIWSQSAGDASESYLRLLMSAAEPAVQYPSRLRTILPTARPVYYDFDLFSRAGGSTELDDRLLTELPCTVFDTETTGLNLREGDDIVALGAVRIVNGRLLESEIFEQLVRPECALRPDSIRIHGIQPEMLVGQPDIASVLQLFHRFAEGTVLVAHNAAFDMRLLQHHAERCGLAFEHPVLDTMLLSAAVHPAQDQHDLESIADRLGITIMGRHTALGDALAAAEIYLKLIPLLSGAGIATLRQAREASQKTYYARLKY
jgi:DNA polymerase-3 subunit epsilon